MNTLIHADIFFFVTTIAVAIVAAACVVLLVYAIVWIRTLFRISKSIEDETKKVVADVEEFRSALKKKGEGWRKKLSALKRFFLLRKNKIFRDDVSL